MKEIRTGDVGICKSKVGTEEETKLKAVKPREYEI